ncbi:MAG: tRNA (cytidine(56)-2'-O)-methyltransferase [Candidatus Thermoplasmatota archaeon]|nr:tRNA (cytidine(56)-2'-O)-methyltransferase [Candidatus Thermoplasmatota archaeon]
MKISVLRLGHRPQRDKRVTTHVCLVARAFGASEVFVTTKDLKLKESIEKVKAKFGDDLKLLFCKNWQELVKNWDGIKVHLTMYGEHINEALQKIPQDKDLLVIVGAEKVPSAVFELADLNIAVGNQPHSEVAALAVFLDRFLKGEELYKDFKGARIKIIPTKRGKNIRRTPN